jgi:hypothetical protein
MNDPNATSQVKEIIATTAVQEKANAWESKGKLSRGQNGFIYMNLFAKSVTIRVSPGGMEVL